MKTKVQHTVANKNTWQTRTDFLTEKLQPWHQTASRNLTWTLIIALSVLEKLPVLHRYRARAESAFPDHYQLKRFSALFHSMPAQLPGKNVKAWKIGRSVLILAWPRTKPWSKRGLPATPHTSDNEINYLHHDTRHSWEWACRKTCTSWCNLTFGAGKGSRPCTSLIGLISWFLRSHINHQYFPDTLAIVWSNLALRVGKWYWNHDLGHTEAR